MKCISCDALLSDFEATRKNDYGYIDLCNHCFKEVKDIIQHAVERPDLATDQDTSDFLDSEYGEIDVDTL